MNKKNLFQMMAIMMVSMLSVGFASCSSDDEEFSNPLVGTWYTDKYSYTEITYKSDMTCIYKLYKNDKVTIRETDYGRYQVDGNLLSIWWDSEKEYGAWTTQFSISGNVMTTTEGVTWYKK